MKKCTMCSNELKGNQTKFCSNTCKQRGHYHLTKTNPNTIWSQTKRGNDRKRYFIEKLGGKCSSCGYCKNMSALDFHHVSDKSFALSIRKLSNTNLASLEKEAQKCILLCANCHREHHYPENIL